MYVFMHACIPAFKMIIVCTYICMYAFMHACFVRTHACIYASIHTHTYIHTYIHTYTHVCIHTHAYTHAVFLDEIDAIVGKRSLEGADGGEAAGVQQRVLSTLLNEMVSMCVCIYIYIHKHYTRIYIYILYIHKHLSLDGGKDAGVCNRWYFLCY